MNSYEQMMELSDVLMDYGIELSFSTQHDVVGVAEFAITCTLTHENRIINDLILIKQIKDAISDDQFLNEEFNLFLTLMKLRGAGDE